MAYSSLARAMITMWNSHFSKTIFEREDGTNARLNVVKMFDLSPTTRNSNKKLGISEYKQPNANVLYPSKDGIKIAASIWLNDKPSTKWIVGIHGFNSSRFDVLYLTWHYRQLGYNIITFDFRNHGGSEVDVVSWGLREKWDLIATVEWLTKNYKVSEIGLIGTSMGGFTLNHFMLTETELIKKANIRWGIADSAYMSVPMLLERMITNNSPKMFEGYAKEVLNDMMAIYREEYGVDLTGLGFINLIEPKKTYIPMLYFHNRYDRVTDYLDSFRMCDIKNNIENDTKNEVKIFDDGYHHTKSLIEFEEEYKKISLKFVKKHQLPEEK
ncbi:alpha/beta hydrolase family protein [[Acholeplasma] multilocale]|uniref:alpha/beta hydrolase family protein n=1 Tax=[Acholeplasma] multilocale TaxID=264638 RepID=UPI00047A4D1A|nr:alpha/beta fold hydrolase [[Acholeplasma] multilocale]